jgi:hypothetical protein
MAAANSLRWPEVGARVAAGLLGAYAFSWGFAAAVVAGLVTAGVDFHDAEMSAHMLAFLLFPGLLLWSFAAARLGRVWAVLAGGAALQWALAWALQRALLAA